METAFLLVCSHFVCDYPLQSEFIAVGKNPAKSPYHGVPWFWIMAAHAFTHGLGVFLATRWISLGIAETVIHFGIDWAKCRDWFGINVDQLLHLTCKALWVLIFFTVH
jgi:hypothetical protein